MILSGCIHPSVSLIYIVCMPGTGTFPVLALFKASPAYKSHLDAFHPVIECLLGVRCTVGSPESWFPSTGGAQSNRGGGCSRWDCPAAGERHSSGEQLPGMWTKLGEGRLSCKRVNQKRSWREVRPTSVARPGAYGERNKPGRRGLAAPHSACCWKLHFNKIPVMFRYQ